MSISIMTLVWSESQHKGSELLLLLAIADNANDQGVAYPSLRTLAKKTRMSRRNVIFLIKKLAESGELRVGIGTGPRRTNTYYVSLPNGENFSPRMKSRGENQRRFDGERAVSPEPNTKPKEKKEEKPFSLSMDNGPTGPEDQVSLTPIELKRLGLTPGSVVWRALVRNTEPGS
jgi:helix-turn-helix protein